MTTKIGLIGCGEIAAWHARGYLAISEEAQITAVSDVAEANAQKMAQDVGAAHVFGHFRALLGESDVDAVDICLPHHLHRDAIVAAATVGKHILCEKPLCLNLDEADEIRRIITANGVTLMCAHNQLFAPAVQQAKRLLAEGVLGRIYEIRTLDTFRYLLTKSNAGWRSKKETMGGGELIDTGYHPSYLLLYLADSTPVEVTAMLSTHRLWSMDGEDSAQVLVRFANGAIGNIVTSWAYEPPIGSWQFQVIGERGQIYGRHNVLHYQINEGAPETVTLPEVNTFEAEIAHFVACLRNQHRPIQTEVDGIHVLKLILGAYQSQMEKRAVVLCPDQ